MRFLRLCRRGYTSSAPVQARLFSLSAREEGQDTFSATMGLAAGRTFTLAAQETGSDTFSGSLLTGRAFTLAAQESGVDTFSAAIASGRVFSLSAQEAGSDTFSATLERGRIFSMAAQESGSDTFSGTFTTSPASVNPVISSATFTNTEDGTRDSLETIGTYAGADTIDQRLEFYEGLTLRATATLLNVTVTSGNFNFSVNVDPGDLVYESGSGPSDMPNVDNIDVTMFERNNGGTATTNETGVSGLDVIAPTFSSAVVENAAPSDVVVTFSEAMRGSTTAADWDVQVNASPATESGVAFTPGATTATITLGAAVSNGDTVTVAYNGTGLTDEDGNALATFTAQSVTNNVAAAPTVLDDFNRSDRDITTDAAWAGTADHTAGSADIVSNQLVFAAASDFVWANIEHQDARTDEQWAECEWVGSTGSFNEVGPCVRMADSGGADCYTAQYDVTGNQVRLRRYSNGVSLNLGAAFTGITLSPGDTWGIHANGDQISFYLNGVLQGTRTEATFASGNIGMRCLVGNGGPSVTVDNFNGGNGAYGS